MSKLESPPSLRNRDPILEVLRRILPPGGTVLSIASGSGVHDEYFARALPNLIFQPSDPDPTALASIRAYREEAALPNLRDPLKLDVREETWPISQADAILNINMIHISPWSACLGLFRGAAKLLSAQNVLYLYGPYILEGRPLEPSNAAFDRSLRERNPEWGLRELSKVEAAAKNEGFILEEIVSMPANNISAIFRFSATGAVR